MRFLIHFSSLVINPDKPIYLNEERHMSKLDSIKSKVNEAEEFARKIWLAGLGAYGKSFDEAQGQYEKISVEASKMFDELVVKGSKIETEAKDKFQRIQALGACLCILFALACPTAFATSAVV